MSIKTIKFHNFKALESYSISLKNMNILVGPNNCGKSTIISAFRILEVALRTANSKSAGHVPSLSEKSSIGHHISENILPVPIQNVHTNYSDEDSYIEFQLINNNKLFLYFPKDGGCFLNWDSQGQPTRRPSLFRKEFPIKIQVIPVLGPLEQEERIVADETVRQSLGTHRASRHFRNYWYKYPEGFEDFKKMVLKSWPGMVLNRPEISGNSNMLDMFCSENRIDREIFWTGSGFQIWCQLLTHIYRSHQYDFTVIDEPEVYLHPDVQRQLLSLVRETGINIVMATHSTEIIGESDATEIVLIDKNKKKSKRLYDSQGIQEALNSIGSTQNITLAQLARTKKIIFVEGLNDYKIIRKFAQKLKKEKLHSGNDLTAFESGGFSSWKEISSFSTRIKQTHQNVIKISAIYDRDYYCENEINKIKTSLDKNLFFSHIHEKKEIENYLLLPPVLDRILKKNSIDEKSEDIINKIIEEKKSETQSQYMSKYSEYFRSIGTKKDLSTLNQESISLFEKKWKNFPSKISIVSGKEILKEFRNIIQERYSLTLTTIKIIDEFNIAEIPTDLINLINKLEEYRKA